jgi:hypothetical protein
MCRLCTWLAGNRNGRPLLLNGSSCVAWWLEFANTANPQSRSVQIEHGPTTSWGRRIQGGARRATECWRSRICKFAHRFHLSCAPPSFPSGRNYIRACRMAAWSVLSRTRGCGDFHRFQNSQCSFDPRVCRVMFLAATIGRPRCCYRLSVDYRILVARFTVSLNLYTLSLAPPNRYVVDRDLAKLLV